MQIIIISSNSKTHKHWHLSPAWLLTLILLLMTLVGYGAYRLAYWMPTYDSNPHPLQLTNPTQITPTITEISQLDIAMDDSAMQNLYAQQLGGLQAETLRLKMFSERLAEMTGFDSSSFSFDEHPPLGGIEQDGLMLGGDALDSGIRQLSLALKNQGETLAAIEQYLITQDSIEAGFPDGAPVKDGWVSSFYGNRIDPFNGKKTFHSGIDIAGKTGTPVIAAADGIVTWVGERGAYGGLVEVEHGNGYVTRYAHNKTLKVEKGQRVNKGDVLSLMGSTGRSTGPHVHYEVLRDGVHVNPYNFIQ